MGKRRHLQGLLNSVKLERGHDGFLRGRPEPVLILAAYAVDATQAVLLASARHILRVTGSFPCMAAFPEAPVQMTSKIPRQATRLVVLGVALESDGGEDIAQIQTWLLTPLEWQVRAGDSKLAAPFRLAELGMFPPHMAPDAQSVNLTHRDRDVSKLCKKDDWIDASMVVVSTEAPSRDSWLLHFVSADQRNDWTAELVLQVG